MENKKRKYNMMKNECNDKTVQDNVVTIPETTLKNIHDSIKKLTSDCNELKQQISQLEYLRNIDDRRKEIEYGKLLKSKYGMFGKLDGISLPSKILDSLQFLISNDSTYDFGKPKMKKYVLNELKLMTGDIGRYMEDGQLKYQSKLDQIFYLFIKGKSHTLGYFDLEELEVIAQFVYDLDISNDEKKRDALQIIYSNPYFQDNTNIFLLKNIPIDNRIKLLTNQSKDIRSIDPYIIIDAIIKSGDLEKRYQAEFTAASKLSSSLNILADNLSKQIFLIKDYDKLFNLLSYIAQEDTLFCKSIQKVIFLEKVSQVYANNIFSVSFDILLTNQSNSITPLLEKIANHILKTHNKNVNKMCNFLFYLNNLWVDLEGWWKICGPFEGVGGAGPAWKLICSPELKQTVINILKNIKNVEEDYCSEEIERICSSESFDIKNWRQYVQFQDPKKM